MHDVDALREAGGQGDGVALADLARVSAGGEDDDDRGAGAQLHGGGTEAAMRDVLHDLDGVRLERRHEHLALGIAEADVEFDDLQGRRPPVTMMPT
jgi:hypothetical protein